MAEPGAGTSVVIAVDENATGETIVQSLAMGPRGALIWIIGGEVLHEVEARVTQLVARGLVEAAIDATAVIVDDGTSGVAGILGRAIATREAQVPLVGIASAAAQIAPGHIQLAPAAGREAATLATLVRALSAHGPVVAVIIGGNGDVPREEVLRAVRLRIPIVCVEGTGGFADRLATLVKSPPSFIEDALESEIAADADITIFNVTGTVPAFQGVIGSRLGGSLRSAWKRFAKYDLNAKDHQKGFDRLEKSILLMGLFATACALTRSQIMSMVFEANADQLKDLSGGPRGLVYLSRAGAALDEAWTPFIYWTLKSLWLLTIVLPITISALIAASDRFKNGIKWVVLRGGAEAIKREIFRFRTRTNDYRPGRPEDGRPSREAILAERIDMVTRRALDTEANKSPLTEYVGKLPPPASAEASDDGLSDLTPDRYLKVRLDDQLAFYQRRGVEHAAKMHMWQWLIYSIGGLGTLLAALGAQIWIALTTAVVTAITQFLAYRQMESSLVKYNQSRRDLEAVRDWWTALSPVERTDPKRYDKLVEHTEAVLESEMTGWVQQMENALKRLRETKSDQQLRESPPDDDGDGGGAGGAGGTEAKAEATGDRATPAAKMEALPPSPSPAPPQPAPIAAPEKNKE